MAICPFRFLNIHFIFFFWQVFTWLAENTETNGKILIIYLQKWLNFWAYLFKFHSAQIIEHYTFYRYINVYVPIVLSKILTEIIRSN